MKPGSRRTSSTAPSPAMRLTNRRRCIKAAWSKTGMDEATYRAMLMNVAGVDSSLRLDMAGINKVLDHINGLTGYKAARKHADRPAIEGHACEAQLRKIEALLADMQLPWAYILHSKDPAKPCMVKRLAGVDNLLWANPHGLAALITALANLAARQKDAS